MSNGNANGKLNLRMDLSRWINVAVLIAVAFAGFESRNIKSEIRNLRSQMRLEVREYVDAKTGPLILKIDNLALKVESLDTSVRLILRES